MNAQASFSAMPEHVPDACPSNATQRNRRNATNATGQNLTETPHVPDAPNPVDNPDFVRWRTQVWRVSS